MKILVAGGAGYIGSHTCVALIEAGHEIIIVDSLVNSQKSIIKSLQTITNRKIEFIEADVRDSKSLNRIFAKQHVDAVVNFAGYKAVGESVNKPLDYYDNNLNCTLSLLECMCAHGVRTMVFSSSATVYGEPAELPITEDAPLAPQNPYGRTKQYIEEMLKDVSQSDNSWKIAILRYFNPVGAHPGGLIGEQPSGHPNNLMPIITRVAAGEQDKLYVFGGDYDTPDGTAIRDYIHVMDLASGHSDAIRQLESLEQGRVLTVNLGTGRGYSVLEVLKVYEKVCGRKIPYEIVERRPGDVACCYADPSLAKDEINWESELGLHEMCKHAWNWQIQFGRLSEMKKKKGDRKSP